MLRPRVIGHAASSSSSGASSSSASSALAMDGASFSPTIANLSLSAFDRMKEREYGDDSAGSSCNGVSRTVSAGPLGLQDLEPLEPIDDHENDCEDLGMEDKPQEQDDGEEEDTECDRWLLLEEEEDEEQEVAEDEAALKTLFFRQQQLEKQLLQEQKPEEPEEHHDDVEQFLTRELRFHLPASASDVSKLPSKKSSRSRKPSNESQSTVAANGPSASALTAPMHEQLSIEGSHHRRRRQSNALLPDGDLHLWIYQARQLSFRSHFESMYDRHGLHIRCYLSWRREYLSEVFESRRSIGGNMKNPVWRHEDDHSRNLMRGHFSIPLGNRSSPASLPANAELVIEIVCGILVVSTAKVSLLEFFQDRSSKSSTEDDDDDQEAKDKAGIVSCSPQWYPLIGQDSGLLEMGLEFIPASAFDDDDDEEAEENLAFELEENNNFNYKHELAILQDASGFRLEEDTEPEIQDPSEPNAFEEKYKQLELRTLSRKMRVECPELRDQFEEMQLQHPDSDSELPSGDVVISNNGKTTMYIPPQCQSNLDRSIGFPIQSPMLLQAPSSPNTSIVAHEAIPDQLPTPPPSSEDITVRDLFLFGISSDPTNSQSGKMHRISSCVSQVSQFSWENSEYSQRSGASMFSRKASTCVSDVLAYNELIQEMESSLEAQAAQEQLGRRKRSSPSILLPKSEGYLRFAAPTSDPHPITAAMGIIPTKSALKKGSSTRTYDASNNNEDFDDDFHPASSVRETTPKGVVLFDLKSIPERLRVGFERSVSEEGMPNTRKKDVNLGRRRSLPVNSLSSQGASQASNSISRNNNRGMGGYRNPRQLTIEEQKKDSRTSQEMVERRNRSSSMHSLTDIHGQRKETPENASQQRRQQHHQPGGSRVSSRDDWSSTSRTKQRCNSNTSSLVNVGGAVLGVGKFINVGSVPGVVRYVGPTNFATGTWIGIELCEKKGKNNGTVKGIEVSF